MEFVPIQFTAAALEEYRNLFSECFPGATHFTSAYLNWLYLANPDGRAVGYDAREGGVLAAHYVCIPARARIDGRDVRVLLSLNTATRPQFQGKGLFTKLAAMTFDAGAADGFDGVYGVANGNSTPGFIRKLSFQLVRPLEAMVGVGTLNTRAAALPEPLGFERVWSAEALAWRCASPVNPVRSRRAGAVWQFQARALRGVPAYAELALHAVLPGPVHHDAAMAPLRLYLGLVPDQARSFSTYISIPKRLRPSPLNLIYRAFTPGARPLDPASIQFTFLDFDAY